MIITLDTISNDVLKACKKYVRNPTNGRLAEVRRAMLQGQSDLAEWEYSFEAGKVDRWHPFKQWLVTWLRAMHKDMEDGDCMVFAQHLVRLSE